MGLPLRTALDSPQQWDAFRSWLLAVYDYTGQAGPLAIDAADRAEASALSANDSEVVARNAAVDALALRDGFVSVFGGMGYQPSVAYAAGIALTTPSQTVEYNGESYAPKLSVLPFVTSGVFEADKFRLIQGVASVDLANPELGGQLVHVKRLENFAVGRLLRDKLSENVSPKDFGAIGDGTLHPLSERFTTLDSAKVVFPFATDLNDSIDWAVFQALLNLADTGKKFKIEAKDGIFFLTKGLLYGENFSLECSPYTVEFLLGWSGGFRKAFAPKRLDISFPTVINLRVADPNRVLMPDDRGVGVTYDGATSAYSVAIDVTGTYRAHVRWTRGKDLHGVVYAGAGPDGVHQPTKVPAIHGTEAQNCNYRIWFPGTEQNRFSYGDIEVFVGCSKGNTRYGDLILDTDGLVYNGNTMFPNGGLVANGNQLNIAASQLFDPRIPNVTEPSGYVPMNLHIPPRRGGALSEQVKALGVSLAYAGQGPAGYRQGPNARISGVRGLTMVANAHEATQENLVLFNVRQFDVTINAINANDQGTAAKSSPGSFDSIRIGGASRNGKIRGVILAGYSRYAVNMEDGCLNVHADVVTEGGTPGGVRLPADNDTCTYLERRLTNAVGGYTTSGDPINALAVTNLVAGPQIISIKQRNNLVVTLAGANGAVLTGIAGAATGTRFSLVLLGNLVLRSTANGGDFFFNSGTADVQGPRALDVVRRFDGVWCER